MTPATLPPLKDPSTAPAAEDPTAPQGNTSGGEGDPDRVVMLRVDQIELDRRNHREPALEDEGELKQLAASIEEHGLQQPLLVNRITDQAPPRYRLIYGHRRLAAVTTLGHDEVRCVVRDNVPEDEVLALRAIENLHRKELNVMEEAVAVHQLMAWRGATLARVAEAVGQEEGWVRERLWIHDHASKETKRLALRGLLMLGHLRQLVKIQDPKMQDDVASMGVREGDPDDERNGATRVESVGWFRGQAELAQRALKSVKWDLDVAFAKKPACTGCPHNTATDAQLFETGGAAGAGACTNRACFEVKSQAAEKAVQVTIDKVKKAGGDTAPSSIKSHTPTYLKDATAVRAVKKALDKPKGKKGSAAKPAGGDHDDPRKRPLSELGRCVLGFQKAVAKWEAAVGGALFQRVNASKPLRVMFALLPRATRVDDNLGEHERQYYGHATAKAPGKLRQLSSKYRREFVSPIEAAAAADAEVPAWLAGQAAKLSKLSLEKNRWQLPWSCVKQLAAIANAAGVTVPPIPDWKDYAPKPESKAKASPPKKASKSASKKKPTRKKEAKKKAARSTKKKAGAR